MKWVLIGPAKARFRPKRGGFFLRKRKKKNIVANESEERVTDSVVGRLASCVVQKDKISRPYIHIRTIHTHIQHS